MSTAPPRKSGKDKTTKVKVIVRLRPFLSHENKQSGCITLPPSLSKSSSENSKDQTEDQQEEQVGKVVEIQNVAVSQSDILRFQFDRCYGPTSSQDSIFNEVKGVIPSVLKGIHATIFAYGITGSGKTHTMQGNEEHPGIIPRAAENLLNFAKEKQKENPNLSIDIRVSYLEIYNEKVLDLLVPPQQRKSDLPIRESSDRAIFIQGLTEKSITTPQEFADAYREGCTNRSVAPTLLNPESSRSHAVLILKTTVRVKKGDSHVVYNGKLHLIDLAGSEDNRRTGNTGKRLTESSSINTSLFVLGKVVDALNSGGRDRVPYRDSRLTRLLQDSLGGKSIGIMFANIAADVKYYSDTVSTLNFASKSRQIVNQLQVNSVESRTVKVKEVTPAPSAAATRRKRKVPSSSYSKENTGGNTMTYVSGDLSQVERRLEEKIQRQLENKLICPQLKKRMLMDESTMRRLERLEKKVVEQANDQASFALDGMDGPKQGGTPLAPRLLGAMTPCTKIRTAKDFILEAKNLEKTGHLEGAISLYEKASGLIDNKKLTTKLQSLKRQIKEEEEGEEEESEVEMEEVSRVRRPLDFMGMGRGKGVEESEEEESEEEEMSFYPEEDSFVEEGAGAIEEAILHTLTEGNRSALLGLKLIGPKRADTILLMRDKKELKKVTDLVSIPSFGQKFVEKFMLENGIVA